MGTQAKMTILTFIAAICANFSLALDPKVSFPGLADVPLLAPHALDGLRHPYTPN